MILLSPEVGAFPMLNDTTAWSSATLEVKILSLNHRENGDETTEMCDGGNEKGLDEVASTVNRIARYQQETTRTLRAEIRDVKTLFTTASAMGNY